MALHSAPRHRLPEHVEGASQAGQQIFEGGSGECEPVASRSQFGVEASMTLSASPPTFIAQRVDWDEAERLEPRRMEQNVGARQ